MNGSTREDKREDFFLFSFSSPTYTHTLQSQQSIKVHSEQEMSLDDIFSFIVHNRFPVQGCNGSAAENIGVGRSTTWAEIQTYTNP